MLLLIPWPHLPGAPRQKSAGSEKAVMKNVLPDSGSLKGSPLRKFGVILTGVRSHQGEMVWSQMACRSSDPFAEWRTWHRVTKMPRLGATIKAGKVGVATIHDVAEIPASSRGHERRAACRPNVDRNSACCPTSSSVCIFTAAFAVEEKLPSGPRTSRPGRCRSASFPNDSCNRQKASAERPARRCDRASSMRYGIAFRLRRDGPVLLGAKSVRTR